MPEANLVPDLCRNDVSTAARACIHCGHPKKLPRRSVLAWLGLLPFVIWSFVLIPIAVIGTVSKGGSSVFSGVQDLLLYLLGAVVFGVLALLTRPR